MDGLSTLTIQDNQPAEAGNRHCWTVGTFHRSRHWRRQLEWVVPQQGEQIEHLV